MFSQVSTQLKRLSDATHLSGPLGLFWNRISFSRLTLFYFCFSVLHFVIQLSFQIKAFTINANASSFLSRIVNVAQTTNNSLPFLDGDILRMCSWVPSNLNVDVDSCPVVWNGTQSAPLVNNAAVGNSISSPLTSIIAIASPTSLSTALPQASSSDLYSSAVPVTSSSKSLASKSDQSTSITTSSQAKGTTSASTLATSSDSTSSITPGVNSNSVTSRVTSILFTLSASSSSSSSSSSIPTSTTSGKHTKTITVFVPAETSKSADDGKSANDALDQNNDVDTDVDQSGLARLAGIRLKNLRRDVSISLLPSSKANSVSIKLTGLRGEPDIVLSNGCLWSLNWPVSILDNTKREDMVFIGFQVWVLGMSLVALLNESIPHIVASLATHVIATAWATFQIYHTASFHSDFNRVITEGACKASLIPDYWDARAKAEIPSLALNILALIVSSILTWKLIKLFGWQTFKRVGASLDINRIYRYVLLLSITIQLSLFFMIVTVSLWVDQLMNSVIGDLASYQRLYKVTSLITLTLLIPWLMTGWFAVRRELKVPMIIFMALSVLYLGGWGIMFISTTFRWTFATWSFFAIMASASVFLTVLSIVLGVVCGLNFGKGLAKYLNAQSSDEEDNTSYYTTDSMEKVGFPYSEQPLPTYASLDVKSNYEGLTMGPRFSNKNAEPFEISRVIAYPAPTVSRNKTDLQLQRSNSHGSTNSAGSSHSSNFSSDSYRMGQRRFVIE